LLDIRDESDGPGHDQDDGLDLFIDGAALEMNLEGIAKEWPITDDQRRWVRLLASDAKRLTTSYMDERNRRQALEEEAKSGVFMTGAAGMAEAITRAQERKGSAPTPVTPKRIDDEIDAARKRALRIFTKKLWLFSATAVAAVAFIVFFFARGRFYSFAGSLVLLAAGVALLVTIPLWRDLSTLQRKANQEEGYWLALRAKLAEQEV